MSNLECPIPPLNRLVQENYMTMIAATGEDSITGELGHTRTTPLRWILNKLEKQLLDNSLTKTNDENTSYPETFCSVCLEDHMTTGVEGNPWII